MGAAAERVQLHCAVRPSPLASQRSSSNCERALAARLRATPGTGGSNRARGAQRERVGRTLLSPTAAASSLKVRSGNSMPCAHRERDLPPAAVSPPAADPTFSSPPDLPKQNI